jgi:hypothetical protein
MFLGGTSKATTKKCVWFVHQRHFFFDTKFKAPSGHSNKCPTYWGLIHCPNYLPITPQLRIKKFVEDKIVVYLYHRHKNIPNHGKLWELYQ